MSAMTVYMFDVGEQLFDTNGTSVHIHIGTVLIDGGRQLVRHLLHKRNFVTSGIKRSQVF